MPRDQHHAHDWPEYQEYGSHGEYDYTSRSTSGPDPDDYLSTFDRATSRMPLLHAKRLTWMVAVAGGVLLLAIGLIGFIGGVASRSPGRQLIPPQAPRESRSHQFPAGQSLPARPEAPHEENLVSRLAKGVVFIAASKRSSGTGFIVTREGYVVTNEHVINGSTEVTVALSDGTRHQASVVVADPDLDMALLKISSTLPLPVLHLGDSDTVQLGDMVYVLGFPLGTTLGSTITVTDGLISSIR